MGRQTSSTAWKWMFSGCRLYTNRKEKCIKLNGQKYENLTFYKAHQGTNAWHYSSAKA
jgi:hypothetical protein